MKTRQPLVFLLSTQRVDDDSTLDTEGADNWFIEPELAVIIGTKLEGNAVTVEDAKNAIAATASAFELVRQPKGWDRAAQRAVNGSGAGYVLGEQRCGCPSKQALDDAIVHSMCDGEEICSVRAGDVNDNPLQSVAWLARFLSEHGHSLQPGHVILTGSYAGLLPMTANQRWESRVGDLGSVRLQTR